MCRSDQLLYAGLLDDLDLDGGDEATVVGEAQNERATASQLTLRQYQVRSLSTGEDAQGEARVEVMADGREYRGRAVSTDILEASALALVEVINRVERRRALESRDSGLGIRDS